VGGGVVVPRSIGNLAGLHKQKHFLQGQWPQGSRQFPPANNEAGPVSAAVCRPMHLLGPWVSAAKWGYSRLSLSWTIRNVFWYAIPCSSASFCLSLLSPHPTPLEQNSWPPHPWLSAAVLCSYAFPLCSPSTPWAKLQATKFLSVFSLTIHILFSPGLGDCVTRIRMRPSSVELLQYISICSVPSPCHPSFHLILESSLLVVSTLLFICETAEFGEDE
jgi:hypothetical protein